MFEHKHHRKAHIESCEQAWESAALLTMLAISSKSVRDGRNKPANQAFADIRKRVREAAG